MARALCGLRPSPSPQKAALLLPEAPGRGKGPEQSSWGLVPLCFSNLPQSTLRHPGCSQPQATVHFQCLLVTPPHPHPQVDSELLIESATVIHQNSLACHSPSATPLRRALWGPRSAPCLAGASPSHPGLRALTPEVSMLDGTTSHLIFRGPTL